MKYYSVSGTDNNTEFYYRNKSVLKYCIKCNLIINREEAIDLSIGIFRIKKKNYNFSSCTDGPEIASSQFVEVYTKYGMSGLTFIDLPKSDGFFLIKYDSVVNYDYKFNPDLYMDDKCSECQQFQEISLVRPIKIIKEDEEKLKPKSFYRTDLEYGAKVRRAPLILATDNIPILFREVKMKDVYFEIAGKD